MGQAKFLPRTLGLSLLLAWANAQAAAPTPEQLLQQMQQLSARIEKLEKRNAELEARLAGSAAPNLPQRVAALEAERKAMDEGLASERLSDKEPELATRLKSLETKVEAQHPATALAEALDGIGVEGSVGAVAQHVNGKAHTDGRDETTLGWRGDLGITLPGGEVGRAKGEFYVHLRMGQGGGASGLRPTFTGAFDSLSFQQQDVRSSNTNAIVAQAWYQLTAPLDAGEESARTLQFTVGKMDPFVFFDQNALADDESSKFLNNVFVHNPMLDSGGAVGADDYGFSPGARLAYTDEGGDLPWQASVGAFGAGDGASFDHSFTKPFVIGQLETTLKFSGLTGNYRAYAWHNGQYEGYADGTGHTAGWGLSADQQVSESLALFARYGHGMNGRTAFDRAVTVGAELTGDAWGRGADEVGLAYAWLRSSHGFRAAAPGLADYGYAAAGAEHVAELYYRYRVNDRIALTPDLQHVRHPGADPDADPVTTVALRALYAF